MLKKCEFPCNPLPFYLFSSVFITTFAENLNKTYVWIIEKLK